jgi:hypothetical protein
MEIIGRTTRVHIPTLGIRDLLAKSDTGAYRSSLHAEDIRIKRRGGKDILTFRPIDRRHKEVAFEHFGRVQIRNSFGEIEDRYIVDIEIVRKGKSVKASISLADRSKQTVMLLLGRQYLINGNYVVHVKRQAKGSPPEGI